jgi:hypothetical protein
MHACVVTVYTIHGDLVGLLPCYATKKPLTGRVLRFMGSGEICSDYLTLLAAPGYEQAVAGCVGNWLSKTAVGEWSLVELDGVEQADRTTQYLLDWLRSRGFIVSHTGGAWNGLLWATRSTSGARSTRKSRCRSTDISSASCLFSFWSEPR